MCQLNVLGLAPFISWTSNCSLCFKLQAYTHAHFGMQSMLVVYTVLPVCLGPIALLHHPIRCKRDTTGRGGDGLGGKRWGSSLVPWLIPNEMQVHSLCVCWVPLFFLSCCPFPVQFFYFMHSAFFRMYFYFQFFGNTSTTSSLLLFCSFFINHSDYWKLSREIFYISKQLMKWIERRKKLCLQSYLCSLGLLTFFLIHHSTKTIPLLPSTVNKQTLVEELAVVGSQLCPRMSHVLCCSKEHKSFS